MLSTQGSDTRRGAGILLLNLIGQCGPLLGTNIFPADEGPRYVKGMAISAAFTFFTGFLALGLRTLLRWENRRLDKEFGSGEEMGGRAGDAGEGGGTAPGEENYGPRFRYVL